MKVLVTGGGGQLARALSRSAPSHLDLFAPTRQDCDVTNAAQVQSIVREVRPEVIINTAAYTGVDKAEAEPDIAFAVNERGAGNVAKAAASVGARIIQISTDYVFDGAETSPYRTDARTFPLNVYGASKLAGEAEVRASGARATIVRCGWLFSSDGKNFLLTMLKSMREGSALRVVNDQLGVPSACRDLATFLWWCAEADGCPEIMHWTNWGTGTWYDFAVAIQRLAAERSLVRKPVEITAISSGDYPGKAQRPPYSVLDARESWTLSGIIPDHWLAATEKTLDELAVRGNDPVPQ